MGFPGGSEVKASACNAGDLGSIPGLQRCPGEGHGNPLQYSGLENSIYCIVHGVAKSWTWPSDFQFHFLRHIEVLTPVSANVTLFENRVFADVIKFQ